MNYRAPLALTVTAALALAGCSNQEGSEPALNDASPAAQQQTSADASEAGADPKESARSVYEEVIAHPGDIEFNYPNEDAGLSNGTKSTPSGFQYAIVEATGDDIPELLVRRGTLEPNPVAVFSTENDGQDLVTVKDVLVDGAASAGGYRASVMAAESGVGLIQVEGQSLSRSHDATEFTIDGTKLVAGPKSSFDPSSAGPAGARAIEWTDTGDTSGLDTITAVGTGTDSADNGAEDEAVDGPNPTPPAGMAPGGSDASSGADPAPEEGANSAGDLEKCTYRKNRQRGEGNPADAASTVTGTVRKAKARELAGDDPNIVSGGYGSTEVWMLVLDSPVTLSGKMSGRPGEVKIRANQECIGLNKGDAWDGYEGTKVTLRVDGGASGYWQSDASVPWGTLRLSSIPADIL